MKGKKLPFTFLISTTFAPAVSIVSFIAALVGTAILGEVALLLLAVGVGGLVLKGEAKFAIFVVAGLIVYILCSIIENRRR